MDVLVFLALIIVVGLLAALIGGIFALYAKSSDS